MNTEVTGEGANAGRVSLLEYFEFVAATARQPHVRHLHSLYAAQEKQRLGLSGSEQRGMDTVNRTNTGSEGYCL
jgi:hypothetical protein